MEITEIVLEILIILIGVYLAFFKSYFEEKGKNLATKEDIQDITEKVEKIKYELKKSYDLDKPSLDYSVELDRSLINKLFAANKAIFKYFQLNERDLSDFAEKIKILIEFLAEYQVRYRDVFAVQGIMDSWKIFFTHMDNNDYISANQSLKTMSTHIEELMSYFVKPLTK
jgi:hypothetical protein